MIIWTDEDKNNLLIQIKYYFKRNFAFFVSLIISAISCIFITFVFR
jgi:hypothetical protein